MRSKRKRAKPATPAKREYRDSPKAILAKRAASKSAEASIGRLAIFVPARARSEKRVVTLATKIAHHMATRQAFFASSTLLTSGQNQDELFMEDTPSVQNGKRERGRL